MSEYEKALRDLVLWAIVTMITIAGIWIVVQSGWSQL